MIEIEDISTGELLNMSDESFQKLVERVDRLRRAAHGDGYAEYLDARLANVATALARHKSEEHR